MLPLHKPEVKLAFQNWSSSMPFCLFKGITGLQEQPGLQEEPLRVQQAQSHYYMSLFGIVVGVQLEPWSLSVSLCLSCQLTEHFCLTSIDRVGSLCTRPHGKHRHLCNYPGLFLGLWKQWWLQLAAVVKGITELLSHGLLVISRPSAHTGDRAVMLSGGAGLSGCPGCSLLTVL